MLRPRPPFCRSAPPSVMPSCRPALKLYSPKVPNFEFGACVQFGVLCLGPNLFGSGDLGFGACVLGQGKRDPWILPSPCWSGPLGTRPWQKRRRSVRTFGRSIAWHRRHKLDLGPGPASKREGCGAGGLDRHRNAHHHSYSAIYADRSVLRWGNMVSAQLV